jgi:hypothetical protein
VTVTQDDLRRVLVDAPTERPERKFGLYSVATRPVLGAHEGFGVEYEPDMCLIPEAISMALCNVDAQPKSAGIGFEDRIYGDAYVVMAAADCKPVGRSLPEIQARVRRILENGEEPAVERELWPVLAVDAVDVTGGAGPLSFAAALMQLERAFARYGFGANIVAPRELSVVATAGNHTEERDGRLETAVGSRWAFVDYDEVTVGPADGSGEEPVPAPAGSSWMYATGPIVIRRGDIIDRDPLTGMVRGDAGGYTNDTFIMAERIIVPTVDCPAFAVLVENDSEDVTP